MSDLLNTLPGDIPGLLRDFSPLSRVYDPRRPRERGVVLSMPPRTSCYIVKWQFDGVTELLGELTAAHRLDLTDPTGRAHAAWWAEEKAPGVSILKPPGDGFMAPHEARVCHRSVYNVPMTPTQIDTLARIVLRLAGRTP